MEHSIRFANYTDGNGVMWELERYKKEWTVRSFDYRLDDGETVRAPLSEAAAKRILIGAIEADLRPQKAVS